MSTDNTDPVIIYTDGSCSKNPGPGGWACIILHGTNQYALSGGEPETTNNRMELSAAIAALTAVSERKELKEQHIIVHIDSQYVKNGINTWISSWKKNGWKTANKTPVKNKDLWCRLDELNTSLNIQWKWVKGHAGNKYNEWCDSLATAETAKFK